MIKKAEQLGLPVLKSVNIDYYHFLFYSYIAIPVSVELFFCNNKNWYVPVCAPIALAAGLWTTEGYLSIDCLSAKQVVCYIIACYLG